MAVSVVSFMGKIYAHFNNLRKNISRLYEFDPINESWRVVRDVGFWDVGIVVYAPPAPHGVIMYWSDGYYFDGEKWVKTDIPAPVEVDRVNGVAYGKKGRYIYYCDDLDRMLDPSAWKLDVDASKLFPNFAYSGFLMKVGDNVFLGAGERIQTPAEVAKRNAPGDWTVKSYKDIYRPLLALFGGRTIPVGVSPFNTRTFLLGGVEEVGLINAFDGHIYFLTPDGKLKRVLETARAVPHVVKSIHPRWGTETWDETTYGDQIWAGWGCLVGNNAVFHAPGGGTDRPFTTDIWMFDGLQFYKLASIPCAARGITYVDGRLFLVCQPHGGEDVPSPLSWSSHDRAFLLELEFDQLKKSLPPRMLRVWNRYLISAEGLYSDEEYVDQEGYYHPATEILTYGYNKKTIYLISDQNGTLTIEIDPDLRGEWQTLASINVTANKLLSYQITYDFARMRFKFTPVTNATVSAWVVMSMDEELEGELGVRVKPETVQAKHVRSTTTDSQLTIKLSFIPVKSQGSSDDEVKVGCVDRETAYWARVEKERVLCTICPLLYPEGIAV